MDLYIDINSQQAVKSPYDATPLDSIVARVNDTLILNLYLLLPDLADPKSPFNLTRYASAAITANLGIDGAAAAATQSTFAELAPSTTAPTITRAATGSSTLGEYDRVTFASQPGSGSYTLVLSGGSVSSKGASSAAARVHPGVTASSEISAKFANMLGTPYMINFTSPILVDVHGVAMTNGGTAPHITEVNVSDLQYLFGWTGSLALTGSQVPPLANGLSGDVFLSILLTPSGGAAQSVLKILVNLAP